jgi:cell division initiation protein
VPGKVSEENMKFSSEDIAQQRFETKFRGFAPEQVREFLTVVARELEKLFGENRRLKRENEELSDELAEYRRRERSLHDALEMARSTADEMTERAEREAEVLIAEAEVSAERAVARSEREVQRQRDELARLKEQRRRVAAELRATLEMHLHLLDSQKMPDFGSEAEEVGPPRAPAAAAATTDH